VGILPEILVDLAEFGGPNFKFEIAHATLLIFGWFYKAVMQI
jgi:hypothetical protein